MNSSLSDLSICILGCGGFIGSHLVASLLSETACTIYGVDITDAKIGDLTENDRFYFTCADVSDLSKIQPLIEKSDVVISLVALCNPSLYNTIPLDVIEINYEHPLKVVKMCSELDKWLIHFSTSEVYGQTVNYVAGKRENNSQQLLSENSTPLILGPISAQRWSYACAKQLLERTLYAYGFQKNLSYTIIRPFNFIGPRMDFIPGVDGDGVPRVIACFMDALLHKKPIQLVDGGRAKRVFTYIDDAVDAIICILQNRKNAHQQIFNVGTPGNEISIKELAEQMIALYSEITQSAQKSECSIEQVSGIEFYGEGYEDSDRRIPDIRNIQEKTGWKPRISLYEALEKTIKSYINYYAHSQKHMEVA